MFPSKKSRLMKDFSESCELISHGIAMKSAMYNVRDLLPAKQIGDIWDSKLSLSISLYRTCVSVCT